MKEFFKDFKDPKFWASICAWTVPISIVIIWIVGLLHCWTRSEIGTFIGAIAGPLAGLAGFLYIYASFIQQQSQFERQSFESIFIKLLENFRIQSQIHFPTNPDKGLMPRLKKCLEPQIKELENHPENSNVGEIFKKSFDDKCNNHLTSDIRTVQELIKLFARILVFIENRPVESKDLYSELFFMQLTEGEIRVYFYGFFHDDFKLAEVEKKVYKQFFIKNEGKGLIKEEHVNWMKS